MLPAFTHVSLGVGPANMKDSPSVVLSGVSCFSVNTALQHSIVTEHTQSHVHHKNLSQHIKYLREFDLYI